jgi:hypothetical protein
MIQVAALVVVKIVGDGLIDGHCLIDGLYTHFGLDTVEQAPPRSASARTKSHELLISYVLYA